jgi:ClpP class serine protease
MLNLDLGTLRLLAFVAIAAILGFPLVLRIQRWLRRRARLLEVVRDRRKKIADLEREHSAAEAKLSDTWTLIEIVHDIDASYFGGSTGYLPPGLLHEETFKIARKIRENPSANLAVVLHTHGGLGEPAEMIARALQNHKGRKEAFIPYTAMSAGSMIALATQCIHMGEVASIGPIDLIIWGFSVDEYKYLLEKKAADRIDDIAMMLARQSAKYSDADNRKLEKLVDAAHNLASVRTLLLSGERAHGDPLPREEAKAAGFAVSDDIPSEIYKLVDARLRILALKKEADRMRLHFGDRLPRNSYPAGEMRQPPRP